MKLTKNALLLNKNDIKDITDKIHKVRFSLLEMQDGLVNHEHPWLVDSLNEGLDEARDLGDVEKVLNTEAGNLCNPEKH